MSLEENSDSLMKLEAGSKPLQQSNDFTLKISALLVVLWQL